MRAERRQEIDALREEGRQTARVGLSVHACPYKSNVEYHSRIHWEAGFRAEAMRIEEERNQESADEWETLKARLSEATTVPELKSVLEGVMQYMEDAYDER